MTRLQFYTGEKKLPAVALRSIEKAVEKRKRGVPLGHIMGCAPFFGRDFVVSPDVLIPRPETERLVEEALKVLNTHYRTSSGTGRRPVPDVLDLGTGSGCIAASLTLERPDCRMTALDASKKALRVARKNFKILGLGQKIRSVQSCLFERFAGKKALWDLIVSNPPYIPEPVWPLLSREVQSEPRSALLAGREGLDLIDALLERAPEFLKPGGWLLVEIGKGQSKKIVKKWASSKVYASLKFEKDLNRIERILIAHVHG